MSIYTTEYVVQSINDAKVQYMLKYPPYSAIIDRYIHLFQCEQSIQQISRSLCQLWYSHQWYLYNVEKTITQTLLLDLNVPITSIPIRFRI